MRTSLSLRVTRTTSILLGLILALGIVLITNSFLSASGFGASWKFVALGDIECKNAVKVASAINKNSNPDLVLLLGDLGYKKTSKCIKDAFDNGIPTVGNHDKAKDILKLWKLKNAVYSYTVNNVTFLSLNSATSVSKQINEVKKQLDAANTNFLIDFIVPFAHYPCITNPSAHHGEWKDCKNKLVPLFEQSGKTKLYVNGHNHGYQECHVGDITFITAGSGGRKPYKWGNQMDDGCKNNITDTNGYLEMTVWDNQSMSGRMVDLNGFSNENTDFSITK